jgi:hypothetical protein
MIAMVKNVMKGLVLMMMVALAVLIQVVASASGQPLHF